MKTDSITVKMFVIAAIAGACLIASFLVMGLVSEREARHTEVKTEVGNLWGAPQTVLGPVLVFTPQPTATIPNPDKVYVLPSTLTMVSSLEPEIRQRGIFEAVVYSERIQVNGTFSGADIRAAGFTSGTPVFAVSLSDTRSIAKQVHVTWQGTTIPFEPGVSAPLLRESGIHARVPVSATATEYPFSFELTLNGSEQAMFVPTGKETEVSVSSPWPLPEFTGAFLPTERSVTPDGFTASWQVSSFGRSYPQVFTEDRTVSFESLTASAFGVNLNEGVDLYQQMYRSVAYAALFIVVTFATFFLFEVLSGVRVHPIQYVLIGAGLALFYLLLLSLSEHIGFGLAYLLGTAMTALLITAYSSRVLVTKSRAMVIFSLLAALYGYLYFVLKLEDYALLFGSLLLFGLLAGVMYLTRNVDWFAISKGD